jgi:hypothetical protein
VKTKYQATFKPGAPGGYEGTHWFFTRGERSAFLDRAKRRGIDVAQWLRERIDKAKEPI